MNRTYARALALTLLFLSTATATTYMVPMRDGTRLATDVYLPDDSAAGCPAIFVRMPYNKNVFQRKAHRWTDRGYALVAQDTRGRFASEGTDSVFFTDGRGPNMDGYDTVDWIISQPWSDGRVGAAGASAGGITTYLALASGHPAIVCAISAYAPSDLYAEAMFPGGVYRQQMIDGWMTKHGMAHMLSAVHEHPSRDSLWERVAMPPVVDKINSAVFHWGGWYDPFTAGTVNAFLALKNGGGPNARAHQKLVMGPWDHGGQGKHTVGELTYPANSTEIDLEGMQRAWQDTYLMGSTDAADTLRPVHYYLMGNVDDSTAPGNQWRTADTWPPVGATPTAWYLAEDGMLSPEPPPSESSQSYVHDPRNPVPTTGGANLFKPRGPTDQREIEARADVLVFTTRELEEPLTIAGPVRAMLHASSEARDTDFMVRLCDVYPDGRSMLVCDGAVRARYREGPRWESFLEPGEVCEFTINLGPTALVFNRGHRVRISVSSSNFPRYAVNPNTPTPFLHDTVGVPARNTIYFGGTRPSRIILSALAREPYERNAE